MILRAAVHAFLNRVNQSVNGVGFGMKPTDDWETYLCTDCGYFENYLTHADWLSKIKADPKKAEWRRPE